jgi:hypothetical protein
MIVAKAATLDRTKETEVEAYNKLVESYTNLEYGTSISNTKRKQKKTDQELQEHFNKLFKDKDGKTKQVSFQVLEQ